MICGQILKSIALDKFGLYSGAKIMLVNKIISGSLVTNSVLFNFPSFGGGRLCLFFIEFL